MDPRPSQNEDIASDLSVLLETQIRGLAHAKWQAAGCPVLGTDEERHKFWYAAEKEILERNAIRADRHD